MESLKAGNKTDLFLFKDMNQRGAEVWEIDHITSYVKCFQASIESVNLLFLQCLFFYCIFLDAKFSYSILPQNIFSNKLKMFSIKKREENSPFYK